MPNSTVVALQEEQSEEEEEDEHSLVPDDYIPNPRNKLYGPSVLEPRTDLPGEHGYNAGITRLAVFYKQAVFLNGVIEVSAGVSPGGGRISRPVLVGTDCRRVDAVVKEL